MRSKIAPPAENKCIENREETHQPLYVVNHLKRDDSYVVRKIKQQIAENCSFLLLQVLYYNLEQQLCQGLLKIKISTQNLIRSKQRKSKSRSSPSCRRKAVGTHIGLKDIFWNQEAGIAAKNLDKAGFLLDLFRNMWYNVKCRIINSKNEY